jgi:hypothetical protein
MPDIAFGPGFYEREVVGAPPRELRNLFPEAAPNMPDRQFILLRTPGLTTYENLSGTKTRGLGTSVDQFNNDLFVVYDDQFKRITTGNTVSANIQVGATTNIAQARITYSLLSGGTFSTGSIVTSSGSGSATVVKDDGVDSMSLTLVTNGDFAKGQTITQGGVTATIDSYTQDTPVSMAFSAIQEMAFTSAGTAYVYNGTTLVDVLASGGTIGDLNYVNVVYLSGRFVFIPNDDDQFWWSEVLDGDNVNALNFATAERKGSNLRAGTEFRGDLWLFEKDNIEIWQPTGRADLPFQLRPGGIIDKGIIGPWAHTRVGQSLFWMGDDRVVYRAEGASATPISTPAVSEHLQGLAEAAAFVTAFSYVEDGHQFVVFNVGDPATENAAWVFDTTTNEWHERVSAGEMVPLAQRPGYVPWLYVWWNSNHYVGNRYDAAIHRLDTAAFYEQSVGSATKNEINCLATLFAPTRQYAPCFNFTIDATRGVGTAPPDEDDVNPVMTLSWSDALGREGTYTSGRSLPLGANGEYTTRATTAHLGRMIPPGRVFKIEFSDKTEFALFGARYNEENP